MDGGTTDRLHEPPSDGAALGPYRLLELIGHGRMGEVYRALDPGHQRTVALRLLPATIAADDEFRDRFRRQAALAASITEPHVIPVHDYGELAGRFYLDMRLVTGTDLAGQLRAAGGRVAPVWAVQILIQIAAGLDAAHRVGLVHRNLTLGNVLLTGSSGSEFAYVADLGLARGDPAAPGAPTDAGTTADELRYAAPERIAGDLADLRTDIYALGGLLFESLVGRPPFPAAQVPALLQAHLHTPVARPSRLVDGLPPGLDEVVTRAMAKDPGERYASAGAMAAAARRAIAGRAPSPARSSPERRSRQLPPNGPGPGPNRSGTSSPASPSPLSPGPVPAVAWGRPLPASPGPGPVAVSGSPSALRAGSAAPGAPPSILSHPAPPRPPPAPQALTFEPAQHRSPRSSGDHRRGGRAWLVVAGALAMALTAVGGVMLARGLGADDPSAVIVEPVRSAGEQPFLPGLGLDRDVVVPVGSAGVFAGDTPGLFGGSRGVSPCEPRQLVTLLQADPAKAEAWSGVHGFAAADLPGYVARFTAVLLRSDTAVTAYGFRDGAAAPHQAVLQAGTAVLVDENGLPRAKCYSGNPLAPPQPPAQPEYEGATWPGFSPSTLTTIESSPAAVVEFTIVDPPTGEVFQRAAGSSGERDH